MSKKMLLIIFLVLSFFGAVLAADDKIPSLDYIVWSGGTIDVYGSGYDKYKVFGAFCGNTGLVLDKYVDSKHLSFKDDEKLDNCGLYLDLKKIDPDSGALSGYKSNTINLSKKLSNYITSSSLQNSGSGYYITLSMRNKPFNPRVFVNNEELTNSSFTIEDNIIKFNYDKYSKYSVLNIYVKEFDKSTNSVSLDLNNELSFSLEKIEKQNDKVKVYFNTSNPGGAKVYLDGNELVKNTEIINPGTLIVNFDSGTNKTSYEIYITDGIKKSQIVKVDISPYIRPYIERLELTESNITGAQNMLYGRNLTEEDPRNIKIIINGKFYNLYGGSYDVERADTLYKFMRMQDFRYDFQQPYIYNIGVENTIQVQVKGVLSNIIKFTPSSLNKAVYSYSLLTGSLLKSNYISSFASGSDNSSMDRKIGTLNLLSGQNGSYLFKNIKFNLNTDKKIDFLPIKTLKLGNYYGYIVKKDDLNYEISFENIFVENLDNLNLDLYINLPDNYTGIIFMLKGGDIKYQFLSASQDKDKYKDNTLNIDNIDTTVFKGSYKYSNCFDRNYDYLNCKIAGFTDTSKFIYFYSSGTFETLNNLGSSISTGNTISVVNTGNILSNTGNNNHISSNDIILTEIDKFVENKSNGSVQKKDELYRVLYSKLYVIYKNTKSSERKLLIKSILLHIKSQVNG